MNRSAATGFDYLLLAGSVVVIAGGALAFGAVYSWAYTPLAIACAAVGLLALVGRRHAGPPIGALALALSAIAGATALQLVPLDAATFARLSPAADAFLRNYDLHYQVAS